MGERSVQTKETESKPLMIVAILMAADILGIYLSFYIASAARQFIIPWVGGIVSWPVYLPVVALGVISVVSMFLVYGLYPGYGLTAVKEIEKSVKSLTIIFVFLGIAIYFLRANVDFPRSIFLFAWIFSLVLIPVFRIIVRNRLSLSGVYGVPVLFIIKNKEFTAIIESLKRCRRMGWKPLAVLSIEEPPKAPGNISGMPSLASLDELFRLKTSANVNTVVFVTDTVIAKNDYQMDIIRKLSAHFQSIVLASSTFDFGSIWVEPRDLEGRLGLELHYHLLNSKILFLKRVVDVVGAVVLLVMTSPLWPIISILIKLDSYGPILYSHERIGKNGTPFKLWKFRSMKANAEGELQKYLDANPGAKEEWEEHRKLTDDPRLTNVGKWLRKFSLDEIPQFWNVLKGDMSLIGPRAVTAEEIEKYGDFGQLILRVKPGITGWWQVMGRNQHPWEERTRMEVYYVSNWSPWMEVYITLKTIWVIISGQGK